MLPTAKRIFLRTCLVAALLGPVVGISSTTVRTWTAEDGRQVEAELLGGDSRNITIRRTADKRVYNLYLSRLAEADRKIAAAAIARRQAEIAAITARLPRRGTAKLSDPRSGRVVTMAIPHLDAGDIIERSVAAVDALNGANTTRMLRREHTNLLREFKDLAGSNLESAMDVQEARTVEWLQFVSPVIDELERLTSKPLSLEEPASD